MRIEWDPVKDRANHANHGISFKEARTLFTGGADYLELYDETHSSDEDRFIAIGPVERGMIVVAYTERQDDVVRLISARLATKQEERLFEEYWRGRHE